MIEIPKELWAVRQINLDDESGDAGEFCPPIDDDGTDVILAWPTKEQAEKGLAHQIAMGYFDSGEIIRLFPEE